jgi:hypothetical protein
MEAGINWVQRIVLAALFPLLIWPKADAMHWAALAVFFAILAWNIRQDRLARRTPSAAADTPR